MYGGGIVFRAMPLSQEGGSMVYADVVFGVISFIVGAVFFGLSQSFRAGTSDGVPGAGFFPSILCVMIMIASVALIVKGYREKRHYFNMVKNLKEMTKSTKQLVITVVALIGFFLLWQYVHFLVGITVFLISLNKVYEHRLVTNLIYTGVCVVAIYLLFGEVFHVML